MIFLPAIYLSGKSFEFRRLMFLAFLTNVKLLYYDERTNGHCASNVHPAIKYQAIDQPTNPLPLCSSGTAMLFVMFTQQNEGASTMPTQT